MSKEGSSTSDVKKTVKPGNTRQTASKNLLNKHTRIANETNIKEDFTVLLTSSPYNSLTSEISPVATNNPVPYSHSEAVPQKSADLSISDVNY